MPQTVEKSSTVFKPYRVESLNCCFGGLSLLSLAMDSAFERQQVGERLRLAREALGFGASEFARLHKIDKTKLSHWERGKHLPPLSFVQTLWRDHRISADWLYLGVRDSLPHRLVASLPEAGREDAPAEPATARQEA